MELYYAETRKLSHNYLEYYIYVVWISNFNDFLSNSRTFVINVFPLQRLLWYFNLWVSNMSHNCRKCITKMSMLCFIESHLMTPVWPLRLCVQYCLSISHSLIVVSELPDANNVEETSKSMVKTGDIWIAYMLKKGIMLEVFIKRIKTKKVKHVKIMNKTSVREIQ